MADTSKSQMQVQMEKIEQLEMRINAIATALSTLLTNNATESVSAVMGMKLYKATVVTTEAEVNDKTFLCERIDGKVHLTCDGKEVHLERLPVTAQKAIQDTLDTEHNNPRFQLNLFTLE